MNSLRLLIASIAIGICVLAMAGGASALPRSQSIAMVPSALGKFNNGGQLPTTGIVGAPGVPAGYTPVFTNVSPDAIADGTVADPIAGFDTVVLVGLCDIGTYLADTDFKTRIENFASAGGKLVIWDPECSTTNYSNFVYPFTTNNPGAAGANGTLTDVEENSLSSTNSSDPSYVNDSAVATGTDAVGDSNVFVSFNQNWCVDLKATNVNGVNGPAQTYAHLGSGLIIYSGLDKDAMTNSSPSFDPASASGQTHLHRIWLLELLQPFNPDNLPCGVKVFGLSLSPKTASNPAGTSHTVTAHVTTNATPTAGATVTFSVTAGPNTGATGTCAPVSCMTDANGDVTFTYTSNGTAGSDTIKAETTLAGTGGQQTTVSDTASKDWTAPPTGTITVHKTVDAGGASPTSFCFTLDPDPGNGEVCADSNGDAVFNNVPPGTYDAKETTSAAGYHEVSNDCKGLILAGGGSLRCDVHDTFTAIAHDVDAHLKLDGDIGLGTSGTKTTDVKADCKNEIPAEIVHCTLQVSGLPAGCTAQSSRGPVVSSPGGFLLNDLSSYAVNQTKHFDFKLTITCTPNLAKGVVAILQFKQCADGGFIDPDPCTDSDITPDGSPNVVVRSVKLHR